MTRDFRDELQRAAEELNEQTRTCYKRVGCPACGAVLGMPCTRLGSAGRRSTVPLKHPHVERMNADGIHVR